jgi:hypothetical protein
MKLAPEHPHGELVFYEPEDPGAASRLSRMSKTGAAVRVAHGVYIVGTTLPTEQAVRHHLNAIVAHYWPGAVLSGRTALAGGVPRDGILFVAHPNPRRRTPLELPGVRIIATDGPAALPGDMPMPGGLAVSGPARVLVENVHRRGRPQLFKAGTPAVEDRIDDLARTGGAGKVQETLDQLDVIAGYFDAGAVALVRGRLRALLGSFTDGPAPVSERLAARLAGAPFDGHRTAMLEGLAEVLEARAPAPCAALPPVDRWEWLPFFEAYFSNFIEGTEFGVEEARRIAVDGVVPADRPADAHDVASTYRLVADPDDRIAIPTSGQELLEILMHRHRILMAARPEKHPGALKTQRNFAGGYAFVEPNLVEGTLVQGFDIVNRLHDPFARAATMMLLVTEAHPFDDGNGRVARLMANSELSAAGQVRIVIPTVYRNDYIAALSGVSGGAGRGESLVAVLEFAQRWVTAVDWTTFEGTNAILATCNAYLDPAAADRNGRRLTLPTS